jgi:hypothetical protein
MTIRVIASSRSFEIEKFGWITRPVNRFVPMSNTCRNDAGPVVPVIIAG